MHCCHGLGCMCTVQGTLAIQTCGLLQEDGRDGEVGEGVNDFSVAGQTPWEPNRPQASLGAQIAVSNI